MDFRELSSGKVAISGSFGPIFAIGREAVRYGKQEAEAGIVAGAVISSEPLEREKHRMRSVSAW